MSNHNLPEADEVANDSSWRRGIEKMQTEAPASIRAMTESDRRVDNHLRRLLELSVGCQGWAYTGVYAHSAAAGEYTGRVNTNSCRQRGCPVCREATARGQLRDHKDRTRSVFGDEAVVVRLEAGDGVGPEALRKAVQRLLRRRPVQRAMTPMVRFFSVGGSGRFGATLLVRDRELADLLAGLWVEAGDAAATVEALKGDVFKTVVALRADAEARIFEAVDEGVLGPVTAREWLAQDIGKNRYAWVGAGTTAATTDAGEADAEPEPMEPGGAEDGHDHDNDETPGVPPPEELMGKAEGLVAAYRDRVISDEHFEIYLRHLADQARSGELGDHQVAERIETHLDLLPVDFGDCVRHDRCRLTRTGMAIRTVYVEAAVEAGRASHDETTGEFFWSDESWPAWRRTAERIPAWETERG